MIPLPYVLTAQGVLQFLVLFMVMGRAARREGDFRAGRELALVLAITSGTIAAQAFLVDRAGWLAVVPPLTLTLILLARRSWAVLSQALAIVLLMGGTYIGLTVCMEWFSRLPSKPEARAPERTADAISFHQIADHLDFTGPPSESEPKPEPPAPPAAAVKPPARPKPKPNPVDWAAALEQVEITGTMELFGDREVAFVNGRMMETGQTVQATYRGRLYTWRIANIGKEGVNWERLDVRKLGAGTDGTR